MTTVDSGYPTRFALSDRRLARTLAAALHRPGPCDHPTGGWIGTGGWVELWAPGDTAPVALVRTCCGQQGPP